MSHQRRIAKIALVAAAGTVPLIVAGTAHAATLPAVGALTNTAGGALNQATTTSAMGLDAASQGTGMTTHALGHYAPSQDQGTAGLLGQTTHTVGQVTNLPTSGLGL